MEMWVGQLVQINISLQIWDGYYYISYRVCGGSHSSCSARRGLTYFCFAQNVPPATEQTAMTFGTESQGPQKMM